MVTESFFSLACAAIIAFLFGLALCFGGYRFFLILLPIWGFIAGFMLGGQTIAAILPNETLFGTVTGWVVGFVVGAIFAVLSYLFWFAAVAIVAFSLGYAAGNGLMLAIGLPPGFIAWIVGVIAGVAVAGATIFLNLQKWVVMIATAILGAAVILGGFILLFNPSLQVLQNPVAVVLQSSPLLLILFIALAALGVFVQWRAGQAYTVVEYNRWETPTTTAPM
jgi:hypothetical protein